MTLKKWIRTAVLVLVALAVARVGFGLWLGKHDRAVREIAFAEFRVDSIRAELDSLARARAQVDALQDSIEAEKAARAAERATAVVDRHAALADEDTAIARVDSAIARLEFLAARDIPIEPAEVVVLVRGLRDELVGERAARAREKTAAERIIANDSATIILLRAQYAAEHDLRLRTDSTLMSITASWEDAEARWRAEVEKGSGLFSFDLGLGAVGDVLSGVAICGAGAVTSKALGATSQQAGTGFAVCSGASLALSLAF